MYLTFFNFIPLSSIASLSAAASIVSPGSIKPAKQEYIFSGQPCDRPKRISFPLLINMITTGSILGNCLKLHFMHVFSHPAFSEDNFPPQD